MLSLALLLVLGQTVASAASKLYFNNFSIAAGEEKEIALQFDTDADDIKNIDADIVLPEGLQFVAFSANEYAQLNEDRISGMVSFNYTSGHLKIKGVGDVFTTGSGAVVTFKVKASDNLAKSSTIQVKNIELVNEANSKTTLSNATATITRSDAAEMDSNMTLSFSESTLTVNAGEEVQVSLLMDNPSTAITGLQATVTLSKGISITGFVPSDRLSTLPQYNPATGQMVYMGPAIQGESGALITVTLKADEDFSGKATATLSGIAATTASAQSIVQDDITLTVNVLEQQGGGSTDVTFNFDAEKIALAAGGSQEVKVYMNTEIKVTMLEATLVLPEGVTAAFSKAERAPKPTYNANTGKLAIISGIKDNEGCILKMTLTADDTFKGGTLQLSNIAVTTGSATSYQADAISLTISIPVDKQALQEEINKATTLLGDAAIDVTPGKELKEAIDAAQAVNGNADATQAEVDAAVETLKAAEEIYKVAAQLAADKAAFEAYKGEQKTASDALAQEGDSEACQQLIAAAKAAIDALTYDESKALAENKAAVDAIVNKLKADLDAQRAQEAAEQLAADKAAFEAYKGEQKTASDALAQEGDSEACQQLIAAAKAAIDALTYDESKTLDENKTAVDAIVNKLKEDLAAQREKDATGIQIIKNGNDSQYVIYDMSGKRVSVNDVKKGLYIVNGKKALLK